VTPDDLAAAIPLPVLDERWARTPAEYLHGPLVPPPTSADAPGQPNTDALDDRKGKPDDEGDGEVAPLSYQAPGAISPTTNDRTGQIFARLTTRDRLTLLAGYLLVFGSFAAWAWEIAPT
jgi:hypothetical protein